MSWIKLKNLNESIMGVEGPNDIMNALRDHFTFKARGYQYNPLYKMGQWDGNIRVLKFTRYDNVNGVIHGTIPKGLVASLIKLSRDMKFRLTMDKNLVFEKDDRDLDDYISWLNLPFELRFYQSEILEKSFRFPRRLFLSPTASGKSFVQYMVARRFEKVLVIVPSINLLNQIHSSFLEFSEKNPAKVARMSSKSKDDWENADIIISTWQTAIKKTKEFLNSFDCIIGDECHRFEAKSLTKIMEMADEVHFRYGFTGTIEDSKINKYVLEGIFGPILNVATTSDLIDKGFISDLEINVEILRHPYPSWKSLKKPNHSILTFQDEMKFISENDIRTHAIVDDIQKLNGVTLVLTKYVNHAKTIYDMVNHENKYLIYGDISGQKREELRLEIKQKKNAVVVATYGTMSTGVDIPNIQNLIMAMPLKSKITLLQSIGRGLRLHDDKEKLHVYDYADVLISKTGKALKNHGHNHVLRRYDIYTKEKFNVNVRERDLDGQGQLLR